MIVAVVMVMVLVVVVVVMVVVSVFGIEVVGDAVGHADSSSCMQAQCMSMISRLYLLFQLWGCVPPYLSAACRIRATHPTCASRVRAPPTA